VRDLSATDPLIDDIEALIDESLDDPSRAALVKARIRARLGRPAQAGTPGALAEADDEDLWDNVPF
jgi:hypothetical protein